MCYPKPGPRCSSHARARLDKAKQNFANLSKLKNDKFKGKIAEALKEVTQAQLDYDTTPQGQSRLREKIATAKEEGKDYKGFTERLETGKARRVEAEDAYANAHQKTVDSYGASRFRNENGKLHRKHGPAVVYPNGAEEWYTNGERNREDGPAIVYQDGRGEWYSNGQLHREDGPAIVQEDGTQEWYKNGKRHRAGGPSISNENTGYQEWHLNGKLHREDGPAVTHEDGSEEWWKYSERHRIGGPAVTLSTGHKEWREYDRLHREDGPAIIRKDGSEGWYRRGLKMD